ncbi:MAG: secretin N-terminal domain-containing protein [Phycisphaerales bacterium]
MRTFTLTSARAEEVAQTIRTALDLKSTADARAAALQGIVRTFLNEQGEEVVIRASVTPDRRSNALIVSADDASMEIVSKLISQLDEQPAVAETEYRVLTLKHAKVDDVDYTLSGLLRRRGARPGEAPPSISASIADNTLIVAGTTDQIAEIEKILSELDRPSATKRETEFIPLQFADAEATRTALKVFYGRYAPEAATPGALNVSIVADPATNSLVISADESEWPGIRALLTKLDSEEYDASRRLEVIALKHADAQSVASALQQAFDAPLRAEVERERQRQLEQANRRGGNNDPRFFESPAVLVDTDELVSVSAEPVTNSLIVSAGRKDLERVRAIVERLDVPGFAQMPAPRVLAIKVGRATDVARVLTQMYELTPTGARARTLRTVSIVGDDNASALIVRASDEEYTQIKALADALQQEREVSQVTVRVMALHRQPAARLVQTILRTFAATAQRENEPLAVEADRTSNSLIIASSKRIYDEIERVVRELDGPAPDEQGADAEAPIGLPGQGVFIIEVKNSAPDDVKRMLEQMGLTRPAPADRPGIVSEPINIVTMTTRRAIAVTAAPVDGPIVAELVRSLDADPISPEQEIALVPLRVANAQNVATTLERLLEPGNNDAATALARSIAEQVRRLKIRGQTLETPDISLDLTTPIRIDAEAQTNSILVSSSANNVAAIKQVVELLDRLPIGDAVVVRVFHLENASSDRLAGVVRELFQQGESIGGRPALKSAASRQR